MPQQSTWLCLYMEEEWLWIREAQNFISEKDNCRNAMVTPSKRYQTGTLTMETEIEFSLVCYQWTWWIVDYQEWEALSDRMGWFRMLTILEILLSDLDLSTPVWWLLRREKACLPLQYSCLEDSMDRGWPATLPWCLKRSRTPLKWLSMHTQGPMGTIVLWCIL